MKTVGFLQKAGWAVRPEKMLERERLKNEAVKLSAEREAVLAKKEIMRSALSDMGFSVENSGYSHGGASRRKSWASKYDSESGSAKRDIEENRKLLRERTRDLVMNAPLGAAAVNAMNTNVVGAGLVPMPRIDYEFLGMTRKAAKKLEDLIKREFKIWASSTLCDNNDQNTFYELQQIAFSDWLRNGEEFILLRQEKASDVMPYQLRLKLVEADRICTPGSLGGEYDGFDRQLKNGNVVMNGVEIAKNGKVVAYHIASGYPGEYGAVRLKWTRVPKRGEITGNPNILHIYHAERADQYRGVPFLAPVIATLKQLTRYEEAEIMAAVINSFFNIFITTETGHDVAGFGGVDEEEEENGTGETDNGIYGTESSTGLQDDEITVGTGTVTELKTGEDVKAVESTHPSANFDSFVSAMCTHVGAALEIAPEVLLKKFSNNFSASKGALNETWKAFTKRRGWFVNDFCQPVYELWFAEAVSKGRIHAPGFFNNPLIRAAYVNAKWNGPAQGYMNPLQEVNAAVVRIQNGLSTHEDECASMSGGNFEDNVRTLTVENEMLKKANGETGEENENQEESEENDLWQKRLV